LKYILFKDIVTLYQKSPHLRNPEEKQFLIELIKKIPFFQQYNKESSSFLEFLNQCSESFIFETYPSGFFFS